MTYCFQVLNRMRNVELSRMIMLFCSSIHASFGDFKSEKVSSWIHLSSTGQTSLIGAVIYTVYIEQRKRTLLAITVLYGYSYFFAWIGAFCATLSAGSSYLIHIRGNV